MQSFLSLQQPDYMFSVRNKLNHSRSVRKMSNFGQELHTSLVIRHSREKRSVLHVLNIDSCSAEISGSFVQHHESYAPSVQGATIHLRLMTADCAFAITNAMSKGCPSALIIYKQYFKCMESAVETTADKHR